MGSGAIVLVRSHPKINRDFMVLSSTRKKKKNEIEWIRIIGKWFKREKFVEMEAKAIEWAKNRTGCPGKGEKKKKRKKKGQKGCNTRTSQGVTHPSTTLAQARLTAEF
ncbi:unnamed protein product [Camellia sinensis]